MKIIVKSPGNLLGMNKCKFPIVFDYVLYDVKAKSYVVKGEQILKAGGHPDFFFENLTYLFKRDTVADLYVEEKVNNSSNKVTWKTCVEISDEIELEIENFLDSPNEDNVACLIRSVIEKYLEKTAK